MGRDQSGVRARVSTIQIDFRYRGVRCRETIKRKPTSANLQYAERLRAEILRKIEIDQFVYSDYFPESSKLAIFEPDRVALLEPLLVKDALWDWFNHAKRAKAWQPTYEHHVRNAIENQLDPAFGSLEVRALRPSHIIRWLTDNDLSSARINDLMTPMRGAYGLRDVRRRVTENPLDEIPHYKVVVQREIDPFEPDEMSAILFELEKRSAEVACYYQFAVWAGPRPSELNAIYWSDVDFRRGRVRIKRKRYRGVDYDRTKTDAPRDVDLLEPALEALNRQKRRTFLQGGHIFRNPNTGDPWYSDKAPREVYWYPALKAAGVRQRAPHQCRHTYASWMLSAGENPAWVADQMGDDLQTVIEHYGRYMSSMNEGAGSKALEAYKDATRPHLVTKWSQGDKKGS